MFGGRPWPAPGEALWLEEDRRWAFALLAEEAEQCPACHGHLPETTDPANEFRYTPQPVRCHRCAVQQREMQAFAKDGSTAGLLMTATLDE